MKWRKEALKEVNHLQEVKGMIDDEEEILMLNQRILLLTQELLDQALLKEK